MGKVFLITGTSTGLGKDLAQEVLDQGDSVVATARNPSQLEFTGTNESNYLALKLDVTDDSDIDKAFAETLKKFGRVDVVVNNAGYGLSGPFEEVSNKQIREQFDVNFFGLVNVTRKAMETMREQKPSGGLISQVTSIGGQIGFSLSSVYCASKFAVEGFTEGISKEVKKEWNIKFQCIEPGGFRTDWAGRSMVYADERHPAYDHFNAKEFFKGRNGKQDGDVKKGAKAMYKLMTLDEPPVRAVIGADAYKLVYGKIKEFDEGYKKYEDISCSTDVDDK